MKLIIKSAKLFGFKNHTGQVRDVLADQGKILAVDPDIDCTGQCEVIDGTGLCLLPGLIDMHVHLRDPGYTYKEDIFSGCQAAVAGGFTSIVAMPNTNPVVDSAEIAADIIKRASDAACRVYQVGSITKGLQGKIPTDLAALKAAGVVAVSDDGRPVEDPGMQAAAMRQASGIHLPVISHCEDLALAGKGIINEGAVSSALGVPGIPREAEDVATAREVALAKEYDVPIHIAHVSTRGSLSVIRQAKAQGVKVTCETAPHYFTLTEDELQKRDANFRMNPPLRTGDDRRAVIDAIIDGTIDAIATDHAPHSPGDKADFETAPNGIIGLETSFALSYTMLVKAGHISLDRLVELMSRNPARILHLEGGEIAVGQRADLCIFDPDESWVVDAGALQSKSRNTPFDGRHVFGRVKATVCNGKVVYCNL